MNDPRYPQYPQNPGYPPNPGYPQAPSYPPAPYGNPAPGPVSAAPMAAPGAMPQYYIPDEKTVLAGYDAARQAIARASGGGQRAQYVKFLGPRGETKWNSAVHIGFVSNLPVYILPAPPPKPGQPPSGIYLETVTHFWKSAAHPQGAVIGCPGPGKCLICSAREIGLAHADPQVQKRAKEFGRVKSKYLYQVVLLQYPQAHMGQDGQMRPQILDAGKKLHTAIGDLIQQRGLPRIVDPTNGRPIMLKKVKTGVEERDVEYGALDLEPQPLPTQFYPCLQNLFDLREFVKMPTHEDMVRAVMEMGIPLPGQQQQQQQFAGMGGPASYNPAPQAPWGNPFPQQPQQFQGFQPPQSFQPMGPPPIPGQAPVYTPPGDPYEFPPADAMRGGFQTGAQPQPPPPMQPMGNFQPPNLTPPPVTSQPGFQQAYQPQPGSPGQVQVAQPQQMAPSGAFQGAGAIPPAPPIPQGAPTLSAPSDTPHQITIPVPSGSLSGGRDRCFGKISASDQWCINCPDWIRSQCAQASGQPLPQAQASDAEKLAALQAQLMGQVK